MFAAMKHYGFFRNVIGGWTTSVRLPVVSVLTPKNFSSKNVEPSSDLFEKESNSGAFLGAFASKKNPFPDIHKYNPLTMTSFKLRQWKDKAIREAEILGQSYIARRHEILGCDLASAHFIVHRCGKVKFVGNSEWFKLEKGEETCERLPRKYVRGMFLEGIDASGTGLRYEGFSNLINLNELKWLSLKGCPHIDNWCIDLISGEFQNSLEYLDLSDCLKINYGVFSCFYRFKKLKTLKLNNIVNNREFEFACLLLEDAKPGLNIEGVKYINHES